MERTFVNGLCTQSRYSRFLGSMRELTPQVLDYFTRIDYDREMAYVATIREIGNEFQIGVCRYVALPGSADCEFALAIANQWQRRSLGLHLMMLLMKYARAIGMHAMHGEIRASQFGMLDLCEKLGFHLESSSITPHTRRAVVDLSTLDTQFRLQLFITPNEWGPIQLSNSTASK